MGTVFALFGRRAAVRAPPRLWYMVNPEIVPRTGVMDLYPCSVESSTISRRDHVPNRVDLGLVFRGLDIVRRKELGRKGDVGRLTQKPLALARFRDVPDCRYTTCVVATYFALPVLRQHILSLVKHTLTSD